MSAYWALMAAVACMSFGMGVLFGFLFTWRHLAARRREIRHPRRREPTKPTKLARGRKRWPGKGPKKDG